MSAKKKTDGSDNRIEGDSVPLSLPEDGLGDRIKAKRTALNLTHDGLSELSKTADVSGRGISRTTIRGYELGTYKPGARELRILGQALGVTPSWLILGNDQAERTGAPAGQPDNGKPRWSEWLLLAVSYAGLAVDERRIVRELVESMYRTRVGELEFRPMKALIEDFVDVAQDAFKDAGEQGKALDPAMLKTVLAATALEMGRKHGLAEQNLMQYLSGVLPELLPAIQADISAKGMPKK